MSAEADGGGSTGLEKQRGDCGLVLTWFSPGLILIGSGCRRGKALLSLVLVLSGFVSYFLYLSSFTLTLIWFCLSVVLEKPWFGSSLILIWFWGLSSWLCLGFLLFVILTIYTSFNLLLLKCSSGTIPVLCWI